MTKIFLSVLYRLLPTTLILIYSYCMNICSISGLAHDKNDSIGIKNDSDQGLPPLIFSTKSQERKISSSNCQILGIKLDEVEGENGDFENVFKKLGKATVASTGDASTGCSQVYYKSIKDKVWLIWACYEDGSSFTLCTDCFNGKGNKYEIPSQLVSKNLATSSGLHLGQTPADVIAILGKPNVRHKDALYYRFHSRENTAQKNLQNKNQHQSHPMSDEEINKSYDFHSRDTAIFAKFLNGKLSHLTVARLRAE